MTADRLLKLFDRVADAKDAVPRLRRLVLALAFRGRLVSPAGPAGRGSYRIPAEPPTPDLATLPLGWSWATLGSLAEKITSGSRDWAKHYSTTGAIFVRMGNLSRGSYELRLDSIQRVTPPNDAEGARTALEAGDVLISITGEVGLLGLIPEGFGEAYINQHTCLVRLKPQHRSRYIPEFLRSPAAKLQFDGPQRGVKNSFRLTDVEALLVPMAPEDEQRRIVAKVDELMAVCDELEKAQSRVRSMRSGFSRATFAHSRKAETAATRARLERFREATADAEGVAGLRSLVLDLAVHGRLSQQDLRESTGPLLALPKSARQDSIRAEGVPAGLPANWLMVRLSQICESVTDGDHLPPPRSDTGVPFLVIGNVRSGVVTFSGERFVSTAYFGTLDASRRPRRGDLLYTLVGSFGIPVVVRDDRPFCVQRHIGILRPTPTVDVEYLSLAMRSDSTFAQAEKAATGIAQKTIPLNGLRRFCIPLPPLAEQHRIVAKVDELMALCDRLEAALTLGDTTRSKLLDALIAEALASPQPVNA